MFLTDRAPTSGTHRTRDGYLAADARIARVGIQDYSGAEVGRPDMARVRVYRPPEAVFSAGAMSSAAHKPITVDHPSGDVTAARWKELAAGWTSEAVARDGEYLRVSMMVADQAAIAGIEGGSRELSCGYRCELDWTPGRTPSSETYDAIQRDIRINHVAIVPKGRAGSECRIGDAAISILTDAAGKPATLYDKLTGAPVPLNEDLVQAMIAEAKRLGINLNQYLSDVLKYATAAERLSTATNSAERAAIAGDA